MTITKRKGGEPLGWAHDWQCHCDACIPSRMDEIRAAVAAEMQPTRLDRTFMRATDCALLFVAAMALVLGVVATLPVIGVAAVWAALYACHWSNHKQAGF